MQFANPIFLWALTGLSIPIGIHLLSRKEGKTIKLGSLRHVQETSTQQFKGIRLNEIALLTLRCLLIVLFTLVISGLHWNSVGKQKWLLIEKGLEREIRLKPILDSLANQGYELRFLTDDFPLMEDSGSYLASLNYWSLIEKLKSKNIADVIVFAQNRAENFQGLRSTLPANVRWISQPLGDLDYTLQVVQLKGDSISHRQGHTSSVATYFTTEKPRKVSIIKDIVAPDTIWITIASDLKYAYDLRIIRAALTAICKSFPVELKIREIKSIDPLPVDSFDWLIWLSDENNPKVAVKLLSMNSDSINQQELFFSTNANHMMLTKRLNEEVALRENLTLKLASLLIPREELETRAQLKDRRMLSDSIAWGASQNSRENIVAGAITDSANPYLILTLLALLLIERTIAYQRNQ